MLYYKEMFPLPIKSGTDVDAFNQIRMLSQHYNIHLVSLGLQEISEYDKTKILRYVDELTIIQPLNKRNTLYRVAFSAFYKIKSFLTGIPASVYYAQTSPIRSTIRSLAKRKEFHTALFAYWNSVQLAEELPGSVYKIAYLLDAEFMASARAAEIAQNPRERRRLLKLSKAVKDYEATAYANVDRIITISLYEKDLYKELVPNADVVSVPIVIDTTKFFPVNSRRSLSVMMLGNYLHGPNVDSVKFMLSQIWPLVINEVPGARLEIVGLNSDLLKNDVEGVEGARVVGAVEDLNECMATMGVFAAPMTSGTGVKVKILEAMAAGLPVVTTSLGAEALSAVHGKEIAVNDKPEEIANALVRLLLCPDDAKSLGHRGRNFVLRNHSAESVKHLSKKQYRA